MSSGNHFSDCEVKCDDVVVKRYLNPADELPLEEIYFRKKDATVAITSEIHLTTSNAEDPASERKLSSQYLTGTGFFVKGHYIICPASLVLIPSSMLYNGIVGYNRFPFVSDDQKTPTSPVNEMTSVSRITVDVYNLNGSGHSFTYEADLLAVDGIGDIAILKIDNEKKFNNGFEHPIKSFHPCFEFGNSRGYRTGMKASVIGNSAPNTLKSGIGGNRLINSGVVTFNRSLDSQGWAQQENISVDVEKSVCAIGSPILDAWGRVIGMVTTNGSGPVSGPSEFFMNKSLECMFAAIKCPEKETQELIIDNIGNYHRFLRGYFGVAWNVVTGVDYLTNPSTSGSDYSSNPTGNSNLIVRLDQNGDLATTPSFKELIGLKVKTVAGSTEVTKYQVVGSTAIGNVPALVDSPLLTVIKPNDIITHIRKCPLGEGFRQIPISLLGSVSKPGDEVKIRYHKASDNWESNYEALIVLEEVPKYMDFPWYKYNMFGNSLNNTGIRFHPVS
jgi:hypothetical protein